MEKKIYAISLWDYGIPAFCSGASYYYGTIEEIDHFVKLLTERDKHGFKNTIAAFEHYKRGNKTVTHNVAYNQMRLITPVTLLGEKNQQLSPCKWTFLNTFGAPYFLKCDGGECTQIVVRRSNRYYRCFRYTLKNLQCSTDDEVDSWLPIESRFWGHPCMIDAEIVSESECYLRSNLFAEGNVYENAENALGDLNAESIPEIDAFAKDIFGDG